MRSRHDRLSDMAERRISLGIAGGVLHQRLDDVMLEGPSFTIDGRQYLDFSTCSYLGLNRDPRIVDAAIDALTRYGASYSSSPAYTALPLYDTLEDQLSEMTGGAVALAQTTTLAHLAALPALIGPESLVLIDAQAHESVQAATQNLRGSGVEVETVPHSDMVFLAQRLTEVAKSYEHVWYVADGIYSMYGDVAPVHDVKKLQAIFPNLYAYYDDAHGFGWCGSHGRGYVLSQVPLNSRMVVVAGLSKSFAALGGLMVFGDQRLAQRVRLVGGPLTFSGSIPPAELGAAVASAGIHLSPEHDLLQARLLDDIDYVRQETVRLGLPVVSRDRTPIWFVKVGAIEPLAAITRRMLDDGFFINVATYPVVPVGHAGIRFIHSLHHTREQLGELLEAFAYHFLEVTEEAHVVIDLRDETLALFEAEDEAPDHHESLAPHNRARPAHLA